MMLALKVVLAKHDAVPALVFDEVDQGIGGEAGSRVGEALAVVARGTDRQALVITHLPQIAAYADHHLVVAKGARGGVAILGLPTEEISLDINMVVMKMLTLRGIYGREMYETWYKMTVMLQSGLDIRPAITHRFDFRAHELAFATARSGDSGKVIIDWTS